jgi:hypothetical protein
LRQVLAGGHLLSVEVVSNLAPNLELDRADFVSTLRVIHVHDDVDLITRRVNIVLDLELRTERLHGKPEKPANFLRKQRVDTLFTVLFGSAHQQFLLLGVLLASAHDFCCQNVASRSPQTPDLLTFCHIGWWQVVRQSDLKGISRLASRGFSVGEIGQKKLDSCELGLRCFTFQVASVFLKMSLPDCQFVDTLQVERERICRHLAHVEHHAAADNLASIRKRLREPNVDVATLKRGGVTE